MRTPQLRCGQVWQTVWSESQGHSLSTCLSSIETGWVLPCTWSKGQLALWSLALRCWSQNACCCFQEVGLASKTVATHHISRGRNDVDSPVRRRTTTGRFHDATHGQVVISRAKQSTESTLAPAEVIGQTQTVQLCTNRTGDDPWTLQDPCVSQPQSLHHLVPKTIPRSLNLKPDLNSPSFRSCPRTWTMMDRSNVFRCWKTKLPSWSIVNNR